MKCRPDKCRIFSTLKSICNVRADTALQLTLLIAGSSIDGKCGLWRCW
jgi:hypothetical protein